MAASIIAAVNAEQARLDEVERPRILTNVTRQIIISKDTSDALYASHDTIDARAHAIGVRHAAASRERAAVPVDPPAAGAAPGEPCPPPAQDGLPWSVALPLMTQAAKDLAQLNAVLDFEERQQALAAEGEAIAPPPTQ